MKQKIEQVIRGSSNIPQIFGRAKRKAKYDWSNVPDNVKWIATDADGIVSGFSEKPFFTKNSKLWIPNTNFDYSWVCNIEPFTYHPNNDSPNWENSLEERPL